MLPKKETYCISCLRTDLINSKDAVGSKHRVFEYINALIILVLVSRLAHCHRLTTPFWVWFNTFSDSIAYWSSSWIKRYHTNFTAHCRSNLHPTSIPFSFTCLYLLHFRTQTPLDGDVVNLKYIFREFLHHPLFPITNTTTSDTGGPGVKRDKMPPNVFRSISSYFREWVRGTGGLLRVYRSEWNVCAFASFLVSVYPGKLKVSTFLHC